MNATLEKVLLALVEDIGIPALVRWLLGKTDAEQVQAILDAEYATARALADAKAKAELEP